ncbi:hypothetical protein, partial [uncultured Parolsenella sp.]|uniref:hypothetical protein n=1 Tax=uncultured Parolsenella sp. TaxID=2083008 RepID=UPI0027D9C4CA
MMYAHTLEGVDPKGWQPLSAHLKNASDLAGDFAGALGYANWGRAVGLLHDGGKISEHFQDRLFGRPTRSFDHAKLGAKIAFESYPTLEGIYAQLMAFSLRGITEECPMAWTSLRVAGLRSRSDFLKLLMWMTNVPTLILWTKPGYLFLQ